MGSLPDPPGDQTNQNPDTVEFVPPWQTLSDELLRDMFTEKGVDYAEPMTPYPVPPVLVCTEEPPCTDFLADPVGVTADKKRWPNHLCPGFFLARSTYEWASCIGSGPTTPELTKWRTEWPLPVGKVAVHRKLKHYNQELIDLAPFDEQEEALWAMRVSKADSTADLFGLGIPYVRGEQKAYGWGELRYVLRGGNTQLFDLIKQTKRWWDWFRGEGKMGRPTGSGTWPNRMELWIALRTAVHKLRAQERRVTRENVAGELHCEVRVLARWLKNYTMKWEEVKRIP